GTPMLPASPGIPDFKPAERVRPDVSLATGALVLAPAPDIVSGAGAFPYALPFQRFYNSSYSQYETQLQSDCCGALWSYVDPFANTAGASSYLGGGWHHNYEITADIGSDTDIAFGDSAGLDAATMIAGVVALRDLYSNASFQNRLTALFVADW